MASIELTKRLVLPSGSQIFTFRTPSGVIERSLSAKRSDKGGNLAFVFVCYGSQWRCDRVYAPRGEPGKPGREILIVDATRPS